MTSADSFVSFSVRRNLPFFSVLLIASAWFAIELLSGMIYLCRSFRCVYERIEFWPFERKYFPYFNRWCLEFFYSGIYFEKTMLELVSVRVFDWSSRLGNFARICSAFLVSRIVVHLTQVRMVWRDLISSQFSGVERNFAPNVTFYRLFPEDGSSPYSGKDWFFLLR